MRKDLETYYKVLREVLKTKGCSTAGLQEWQDSHLFPCLAAKNTLYYLATAYDIKKNKFGKNVNETIIKLGRGKNLVIITT